MLLPTYHSFILKAFDTLENFDNELHELMINIIFQGELKDWNNETSIGEVYEINTDLTASCNDENLKLLVDLYKKLKETKQKFKLQNGLS